MRPPLVAAAGEFDRAAVAAADHHPSRHHVILIQDGARLHYAVAIALHRAGLLERMFTECFVKPGSADELFTHMLGAVASAAARSLAGRSCAELRDATIVTNRSLMLRQRLARRRFGSATAYYLWSARQVARWVERRGFDGASALMGYVRNLHPDLIAAAREAGLCIVADQIIAPAAVELAEARTQMQRWRGWQSEEEQESLREYVRWEQQTWPLLDQITCASEYVKNGLLTQGIGTDRIHVLPYPIDAGAISVPDRAARRGPVTVGFVGAVNLRKGAPYFFETARRFDPRRARFVMIGDVLLEPQTVAVQRGNVELIGRVARTEVAAWLKQFDVLYFPSTCEGSAGAVMEALAAGLPVVTSPNAGSVVRDGIDGYIRAYDDIEGHTQCLEQLIDDPDLRCRMSLAARARAESFNLNWYSRELANVFHASSPRPRNPGLA